MVIILSDLQCWAPTMMLPRDSSSMSRYSFSPYVPLCQSVALLVAYQGFVCLLRPSHFWSQTYEPLENFILLFFVLIVAGCLALSNWCCTTTIFAQPAQHKSNCKLCVMRSMCYIKPLTLDLCFPLSPSWIRSTGRSGILWLSSWKWWTEMSIQAQKLCTGLHTFLWVSAVC